MLPGIPLSPPQSHPDWRLGCGCCCSTSCFSVSCGDVKMCCKCFLTQPSPWLAPIFLPSKVSPSFLHSFTLFLRCVRELYTPCFTQACVSGGWQRKRTETSASSGVCAVISFLLVLGIELRTWCVLHMLRPGRASCSHLPPADAVFLCRHRFMEQPRTLQARTWPTPPPFCLVL